MKNREFSPVLDVAFWHLGGNFGSLGFNVALWDSILAL